MSMGTDDAGLTLLADPTRARIVRMIRDSADGRVLVGRVAESLGLRQPTVSHHMAALHDEGIVRREKDGRRVWYSLDPAHEERVSALLGPATASGEADLSRVIDDLTARYRGVFSPETVARYVTDSHRLLTVAGRPALETSRTAAFAASRLDDLTRIEGHAPDRPTVLFVCVQNAGRSQIAAGIVRQLAGDRVIVKTAGSAPAADVRSSIVHALDEIGVPLGGEFPKPLSDEAVRAADWVITMGCGDACPVYPGRRYLDWEIEDPVGKPAEAVRRIRNDIEARVRDLLSSLAETAA
ncbi:metalloregulator ArsR/SmtB family transcription factor [Microbacterium invictum]|uniref:Metalloregulator ArsR/SmtB family transcription factor n=1 Tax=Microbacterium invictum TaxID=515415 RepID=A0ABZ0VD00_9MICO|nr:metalloregulator ArsR/SmtB family transcription factor [Microbacterium invictum]WQB70773.1 metalloregulator ArsR/SmtB family transcription factor [Microbacterium invictum]